jgi:hypothetical protein
MEQASRATSEEAQAELLQLATAWMQIAEEIDGVEGLNSPSSRQAHQ